MTKQYYFRIILSIIDCKNVFLPDKKVLAKESSSCPATDSTSTTKRMMPLETVLSIIFKLSLVRFTRISSIRQIIKKEKKGKKKEEDYFQNTKLMHYFVCAVLITCVSNCRSLPRENLAMFRMLRRTDPHCFPHLV